MPKCYLNKVACNFIEIAIRHGCSLVNFLHIFRPLFLKNTSGQQLLSMIIRNGQSQAFYRKPALEKFVNCLGK